MWCLCRLKVGQEDYVRTTGCHNISIKSEGVALKRSTLVGSTILDSTNKELKLIVAWDQVWAKKC